MKEKLLALLVAKFVGVSEATLERIAAKKAGSVSDESQLQSITDSIDFGQILQSEVDSKITDSNKKAIQNYEATHKLVNGKPVVTDPPKTDPPAPDEPAWFKTYREKQDAETLALKQKLEGYEMKENQATLFAKAKAKLGDKKIPESYWSKRNMSVQSEDQIEAVVTEIESDYNSFKQELINAGVIIDKPASSSSYGGETVDFIKTMKEINKAKES